MQLLSLSSKKISAAVSPPPKTGPSAPGRARSALEIIIDNAYFRD
jgi:hypothetical protein